MQYLNLYGRIMYKQNEGVIKMENISSCTTCVYGNKVILSENILCKKHGVLEGDSPCRKYKFDLTKKVVRKKRTVKKVNLNNIE